MSTATSLSVNPLQRRDFLKLSVAASGGLLIGFHFSGFSKLVAETAKEYSPNAFVRIGTDDRITVIVNHSEMGQGVYTSLPMLLAEELDADWSKVSFESAPVDAVYNHPAFGMQMTGGSSSVWSGFEQFRNAGAAARAMLIAAAAAKWNVDAPTLRAEKSVVHSADGKTLRYGELAESAAKLSPPKDVKLKDAKDFKIIGKPIKRLDVPDKVNGKAIYGMDVKLPGMLTALVARPPVFGATMKSFDDSAASRFPGVKKIVAVPSGVAVIADGFWPAKRARDLLKVEWDIGPMADFNTKSQFEHYAELAKDPGLSARKDGDVSSALSSATKKIEAVYEVPYQSHAMMEPLNCVVDLRPDSCVIWTGTQFQTVDRMAAAQVAGLPPEKVQIHTTLLGCGFGRRANPVSDFVREGVSVAKAAGVPVKVIWTREDDMHGGYYRPAYLHAITGGIDVNGDPVVWRDRIVGQSITAGTPFEAFMVKDGIDSTSVEGAVDMPYSIANISIENHPVKNGVPVLWWRSVGHSHTAFVNESFLDELAALGKQDPYLLRRKLLAKQPRHLRVLELAATKAGWGKKLPAGHSMGIAVHSSFLSYSAQVAEVSVSDGKIHVHRIVCAIDCGRFVNPDIIEAQGYSGAIFGMTAALHCGLTFNKGRIEQSNFHDYPMVRMNECPQIEVHLLPSDEKSGGIGEPGVPCAAPAIANAVFAATGKRLRKLPMRLTEEGL